MASIIRQKAPFDVSSSNYYKLGGFPHLFPALQGICDYVGN